MPAKRRNSSLFENQARRQGFQQIAGVDEAGRGPLAGPVVAAACILPRRIALDGLIDSKKLARLSRSSIYESLKKHPRVSIAIGIVDVEVIDAINILQATLKAMREAINGLDPAPDYLLIDGPQHPAPDLPGEAIIGGDDKSISIAAASIAAKEVRDRLMEAYDERWPGYGFAKHKGYATLEHRAAIAEHGLCPIHRRSFQNAALSEA